MRLIIIIIILLFLLIAPRPSGAAPAATIQKTGSATIQLPPSPPALQRLQLAQAETAAPSAFRRPASGGRIQRSAGNRSLWGQFQQWIIDKQRQLHKQLTAGVRRIKTGNVWLGIWSLSLVSFIYGVVHAIGPGHGKAVITSYVFASERTLKRGLWLAVLSSLMQAVTAVTAVTILTVVLNATGFRIQAIARHLETASYALVALIGLWLVVSQSRKLWQLWRGRHHDPHSHDQHHGHGHGHSHDDGHDHHNHEHGHDHVHDEHCDCGHNHIPAAESLEDKDWSWQKAASIILAIGMRPCTGAIIVLVFAYVNGLYWAGIASTFAMSVGTAITISALAILAVGSKHLALRLYGEQSRSAGLFIGTIALIGGLFVLFLGATLFAGSLGPARPFG